MSSADNLFKAFADPNRRAIFERLTSDDGQTVHALIEHTGVFQPMVSKHLSLMDWSSLGMESVVEFTLTPTDAGTHVRVEQAGFRPDQEANYKGAQYGWQKFMAGLERVLAGLL